MALTDHVDIEISTTGGAVDKTVQNVPMILSCNASFAERIRFYSNLTEVASDFSVTTSPEHLAASAMFAQSPRPAKIAIGRAGGKPTKNYALEVLHATEDHVYQIQVEGEGVTSTLVEVTADSEDTVATIAASFETALEAVVGANYSVDDTGADGTFDVTADAAGEWFSLEVLNLADLSIVEDHAEPTPTLATDLAAINEADSGWYGLYTLYNSIDYVDAAAAWIETEKKIYVPDVNDSSAATVVVGSATDVLEDIQAASYKRTSGYYHPSPADMLGARVLGKCLPALPGTITWAYQELAGVAAPKLSTTQRTNIQNRDANYLKSEVGRSFTWEGTRGDGDYIDVTTGDDWIEDDMGTSVFAAILFAKKIPYTDPGVATIENEVRGSLDRAIAQGILAADPEPVITVPKVADVSTANKSARLLPDISWEATRAGAIHKVSKITGLVSV
jgi:hypothetical protein